MNIDSKMLLLFTFPFIALIFCTIIYYITPTNPSIEPQQPEFLAYVDQLSLYSTQNKQKSLTSDIRDVFTYVAPVTDDKTSTPPPAPETITTPKTPPVVSLIVKKEQGSFCIIDGKKMFVGDKTDSFWVSYIDRNYVTVRHFNGTKEIFHVKAY